MLMVASVKAASTANRVLFIKDGEVFHQIYRGESSDVGFLPEDIGYADAAPDGHSASWRWHKPGNRQALGSGEGLD